MSRTLRVPLELLASGDFATVVVDSDEEVAQAAGMILRNGGAAPDLDPFDSPVFFPDPLPPSVRDDAEELIRHYEPRAEGLDLNLESE